MKTKIISSITAGLMLLSMQGFGQANSTTTYGGVNQDGGGLGNITANPPPGSGNTGFGSLSLGPMGSPIMSGIQNTGIGYQVIYNDTLGSFNTAAGYTSLVSNTRGNYNTADGWKTMFSNTTGIWNTVVGANAMVNDVTGSFNTAIGSSALLNNIVGSNTAVGFEASYSNTRGDSNTAVGLNTMLSNQNGNGDVGHGYEALYNTLSNDNTALGTLASFKNVSGVQTTGAGYKALYSNLASYTTGFGAEALYNNTTGTQNTALGYGALYSNVNGTNNTGCGFDAGFNTGKGDSNSSYGANAFFNNHNQNGNVAVGTNAAFNTNANDNTGVGTLALFGNVNGIQNTAIGYSAGSTASGNYNTALGTFANVVAGISDATAIGSHAKVVGSSNMILGDNTVRVGIGMSGLIPSNKLEISFFSAAGPVPCNASPASTFTDPLCVSASASGASGLQFSDLNFSSVPWPNNPRSGFLTVDDMGNVVLMANAPSAVGTGIGYCPAFGTGLNPLLYNGGYTLQSPSSVFYNFYFDGNHSGALGNADVAIGNGCGYTPQAKLDVLQASNWLNGNSTGIYVENDDADGCNFPIIGIKSFLPAQTPNYTSVKVAGWFEADTTFNCCHLYSQYAVLVPQGGGNVEIGVPIAGGNVPCANNYLLDVYGTGVFATAYTVSDSTLKTDIAPLKKQGEQSADPLSVIKRLNGVSYNFKKSVITDDGMTGTHYGFIAQEVAKVLPNVVKTDAHGRVAVGYNEITPWLVEGMKEQQQVIDSLKTIVQTMQNCLNTICGQTANPAVGNSNISATQEVTLSASADAPLLYQNSPNPFSSGTKINYYLPTGTMGATVVFYDSYGNQMKTIQLSQTGNGTLNITPDNLTNGIYSYSLIVNGAVIDTKRMVLQK